MTHFLVLKEEAAKVMSVFDVPFGAAVIFHVLYEANGRVLTRDTLQQHLDEAIGGDDADVPAHTKYLRAGLKKPGAPPVEIISHRKVGLQLVLTDPNWSFEEELRRVTR